MIDSSEISVVLQGPVRNQTAISIQSIRTLLPSAVIILSTWETENTENLDCDIVIKCKEPQSFIQNRRLGTKNNMNRMIRSTKEGIKGASRAYILKMRSDLVLDSLRFLKTFEQYPDKNDKSIFSHKILVPCVYSRVRLRNHLTPFHLSDWAAFGKREDILKLFLETTEAKEPEFTEWFLIKKHKSIYGDTTIRMAPEQYLIYSAYRRNFNDIDFEDCSDVNIQTQEISNRFIVGNFIVSEYRYSGFKLPKYEVSFDERMLGTDFFDLWTHFNYEMAYKKYCNPSFTISEDNEFYYFSRKGIEIEKIRLKKHISYFNNNKSFHARVEQIFVIPIIFIKLIFNYARFYL